MPAHWALAKPASSIIEITSRMVFLKFIGTLPRQIVGARRSRHVTPVEASRNVALPNVLTLRASYGLDTIATCNGNLRHLRARSAWSGSN